MGETSINNASLISWIEVKLAEKRVKPKQLFFDATGISSATYSQWNKNIYIPSKRKLAAIADYFGVPRELVFSIANGIGIEHHYEESQGLSSSPVVSVDYHAAQKKPAPEGELDAKLIAHIENSTDAEKEDFLQYIEYIKSKRQR